MLKEIEIQFICNCRKIWTIPVWKSWHDTLTHCPCSYFLTPRNLNKSIKMRLIEIQCNVSYTATHHLKLSLKRHFYSSWKIKSYLRSVSLRVMFLPLFVPDCSLFSVLVVWHVDSLQFWEWNKQKQLKYLFSKYCVRTPCELTRIYNLLECKPLRSRKIKVRQFWDLILNPVNAVSLDSFRVNGHSLGFDPQPQNLEPPCSSL